MRIVIDKKCRAKGDRAILAATALRQVRENLPLNVRVKAVNVYLTLEYTDHEEKVALWTGDYERIEEVTLDEGGLIAAVPDELIPESRKKGSPYYIAYKPAHFMKVTIPMLAPDEAQQKKIEAKKRREREEREREEREAERREKERERRIKREQENEERKAARKLEHERKMQEDPEYRDAYLEKEARRVAKGLATKRARRTLGEDSGIPPEAESPVHGQSPPS
ncbi:MAG TPA: hypothetical protein VFO10_18085 [Oligoflexus sp.]|uniref:hypothetical protein n=1 Tax=Oligoflexus sp. TaxID=1971216 RepID=UPI002D800529|nr:hypothetical protein [Oligoflexus sp.]HET9239175.1 hypothetical protein [Oligoflexus sp.]